MLVLPLALSCGAAEKPAGDVGGDTNTDSTEETGEDTNAEYVGNCTALGGVCNDGDQYACRESIPLSGECGQLPGPAYCCLETVPCGPADEGLCMTRYMDCPNRTELTDVSGACNPEWYVCCEQ